MISEPVNSICLTLNARDLGCKRLAQLNIVELEQALSEHGMVLLRGFELSNDESMVSFARKLGPLLAWDFGYVLDLKINEQPQNHIFSQGKVELHWDGAFAGKVPRYNFFQCLASGANEGGGETTFINTVKFFESLPADVQSYYQSQVVRYFTEKKAHYGGAIEEALVSKHPSNDKARLRFIEPFNEDNMAVNPVETSVLGLEQQASDNLLREITARLYASEEFYSHKWTQGEYLLVDNHAMLHGRNRFQGLGLSRHLKRIHIL